MERFARRHAGSDEPEEEVCTIPPGTCVRSIRPGVVAAVFADFVASTVLVRHDDVVREGRVLHTVWGHGTAAGAAGEVGSAAGAAGVVGGAAGVGGSTAGSAAAAARRSWNAVRVRRKTTSKR